MRFHTQPLWWLWSPSLESSLVCLKQTKEDLIWLRGSTRRRWRPHRPLFALLNYYLLSYVEPISACLVIIIYLCWTIMFLCWIFHFSCLLTNIFLILSRYELVLNNPLFVCCCIIHFLCVLNHVCLCCVDGSEYSKCRKRTTCIIIIIIMEWYRNMQPFLETSVISTTSVTFTKVNIDH